MPKHSDLEWPSASAADIWRECFYRAIPSAAAFAGTADGVALRAESIADACYLRMSERNMLAQLAVRSDDSLEPGTGYLVSGGVATRIKNMGKTEG